MRRLILVCGLIANGLQASEEIKGLRIYSYIFDYFSTKYFDSVIISYSKTDSLDDLKFKLCEELYKNVPEIDKDAVSHAQQNPSKMYFTVTPIRGYCGGEWVDNASKLAEAAVDHTINVNIFAPGNILNFQRTVGYTWTEGFFGLVKDSDVKE